MTAYAPSDHTAITIPADGGRGCGQRHERPVIDGEPIQPWGVDCPECSAWLLANDTRWSPTVEDITPTFDERKSAERWEREGSRQQSAIMTAAVAQLAGFSPAQIPPHLQRMISGLQPHVPIAGAVVCPAGHSQAAGMRFCGECGKPMTSPAPAASIGSGSPA